MSVPPWSGRGSRCHWRRRGGCRRLRRSDAGPRRSRRRRSPCMAPPPSPGALPLLWGSVWTPVLVTHYVRGEGLLQMGFYREPGELRCVRSSGLGGRSFRWGSVLLTWGANASPLHVHQHTCLCHSLLSSDDSSTVCWTSLDPPSVCRPTASEKRAPRELRSGLGPPRLSSALLSPRIALL